MARERKSAAVALTIAGSDSGGGAGIQADLKTFASIGVHGTSVITCITAQNPRRVLGVAPSSTSMIRRQLTAVFDELPPQAIKTGMLYSAAIIKEVAGFLNEARPRPILIVDPVLIATSGARLLKTSALQALREDLLPLADLVTPNLPETEALTGFAVHDPEEMRAAARMLHATYGCPALVKGGHLAGWPEAIDIFWDGTTELMLRGPLLRAAKLHGTGCTYGAAVTAYAARGDSIEKAVRHGKDFITTAIHQSVTIGRHRVLKT